jgi:hypothetical protein
MRLASNWSMTGEADIFDFEVLSELLVNKAAAFTDENGHTAGTGALEPSQYGSLACPAGSPTPLQAANSQSLSRSVRARLTNLAFGPLSP